MRKLLLFLGVSISFLSCDLDGIKLGGAPGVPGGGCVWCCSGYRANLFLSDNCDGNPDVINISEEELSRLIEIMKDHSQGECVFITVNPMDGSNPKQGYLKSRGQKAFDCRV